MTVTPTQAPDLPGFRFDGPIEGGEGGYASVFKYEQQSPRRTVAVKVLRAQGLGDRQYRAMFDEATAMAVLEAHPHMVPVFEAKMSTDGQPCIIMMFCGGPNLMTLVTDADSPGGPRLLSVRRVVRLGIQIAGVVQEAHEKDIVHCDIKPANILTDERGSPRLTDFGIAGRLGAAHDSGQQAGLSLPWCPPEIYAGQRASVASDLFSLGATLWHLLAGRSPIDVPGHNSKAELEGRVANPQPVPTGRSDTPQSLELLLAQMMATSPAGRPRSAAEVVARLTAIEHEIGAPHPDEPWHTTTGRSIGVPVAGLAIQTALRPQSEQIDGRTTLRPLVTLPGDLPAKTQIKPQLPPEPPPPPQPQPEPVGRARWLWVAGAAVVVTALAGLLLSRPWEHEAPSRPSTGEASAAAAPDGDGNAGGQGDSLPPGMAQITAVRLDAKTLRFSWTYSASLGSDTFLWRDGANAQPHVVKQPTVDVNSPAGKRICISVKVVRADGSYGTVAWSGEACGE